MLFVVPIESYDNRYTAQWNRWFPQYLRQKNIPFRVITPDNNVAFLNTEDVLDPIGTHLYKFSQLQQIITMIRDGNITDGDTLFFHTLWFSGLDSLQYIRQVRNVAIKFVGVLHAGSYDEWDFRYRVGMDDWSKHIEMAWLSFVDQIYVATNFHRDMLLSKRALNPNKIMVTSLPCDIQEIQDGRSHIAKQDLVAFPHRDVPEKDPGVVQRLMARSPELEIVKTREKCTTKVQYYDLLAQCKVCISNSLQETFGYAMVESAALGCIPLVPDRLSYREQYPEMYRFKTEDELSEKITYYLQHWVDPRPALQPLFDQVQSSLPRMIDLALGSQLLK